VFFSLCSHASKTLQKAKTMKAKRKELSEKLKKIDMRNGSLFASFRFEAKKNRSETGAHSSVVTFA